MERLLSGALSRVVRRGSLSVIFASGHHAVFGDGTGIPPTLRFTSAKWQKEVALDPELKFGEAYMEGGIVIERGDLAGMLALLMSQVGLQVPSLPAKMLTKLRFASALFMILRRILLRA